MEEEYSLIGGVEVVYGTDILICRKPEIYVNLSEPMIGENTVEMSYNIKVVGSEGLKTLGSYNWRAEVGKSGVTPETLGEAIEKMISLIIKTSPENAKKLIQANRPCLYPQTVTC